ncbi:ATPase [Candidatus Beckwithbacteria bacterium CG10_big_fil_rev_8_21_14_0_10_34_10]|uniref:ATPase n=1 Tax=Candidatus Beckwithbacteria bacterium CG10_big_fil_rev_8_21_14_0_10_34_10 TaxID=1974495 RepID=A0A2H0W8T4_9BACT|nr:MAG: ATPase [Candidatus Beckwithbacteria bacterium CG10_big_fil_rev_8_21_14_0_10_34_10]
MVKRKIQSRVEKEFFKGKIIIIYGARRVGKTTLIKEIQKNFPQQSVYFNCDEPGVRKSFENTGSKELKDLIDDWRLVFIDEAQRVKNIGLTLKLIVDNFPHIQVVATGSSSFDLSNKIVEPLTGRKREFYLYPFSLLESARLYSYERIKKSLEEKIIFGMYPEIVLEEKKKGKEVLLKELSKSYLYKDILQYQQVKNPEILSKLLQALALQIGNEVSYNELAGLLKIDKKTVARYINLLEKAFVVFRLRPFSRNLRKELSKLRKIYFYDTGIRNALINNLNPLDLRQDVGALWENFMISERIKNNFNLGTDFNYYFWRTHQKEKIDYLEEAGGKLFGFEFKWKNSRLRKPKTFIQTYPKSELKLINQDSFKDFLRLK